MLNAGAFAIVGAVHGGSSPGWMFVAVVLVLAMVDDEEGSDEWRAVEERSFRCLVLCDMNQNQWRNFDCLLCVSGYTGQVLLGSPSGVANIRFESRTDVIAISA